MKVSLYSSATSCCDAAYRREIGQKGKYISQQILSTISGLTFIYNLDMFYTHYSWEYSNFFDFLLHAPIPGNPDGGDSCHGD